MLSDEEKDIIIIHLEQHLDDSILLRRKEENKIWKKDEEAKVVVQISNQQIIESNDNSYQEMN